MNRKNINYINHLINDIMAIATEKRRETGILDVDYRKIGALNYSSIVKFKKSPVKFYEEFFLGLPDEDNEDTAATVIGTIVDDILLTYRGNLAEFEADFDSGYALMTGEKSTAQAFLLADELYKLTVKDMEIGQDVTDGFSERFQAAFTIVQEAGKYKGKTVSQGIDDFSKTDKNGNCAESYFKTKLANIGKTIVSVGLLEKSQNIAANASTDDFTKELFNFQGNMDVEKLPKFPITFLHRSAFGDIEGKIEVDLLIINHIDRTIQPWDLKSTYDNTQFPYNYIKNSYYIQNGWYSIGIKAWAINNGFKDYITLPFKFVVLDTSKNSRRPLIYRTFPVNSEEALNGFTINNHKYKGVLELVNEICWANNNNVWNISKEAFDNNGILDMENFS